MLLTPWLARPILRLMVVFGERSRCLLFDGLFALDPLREDDGDEAAFVGLFDLERNGEGGRTTGS